MTEIERKALALLRECAEVPAYVNLKAIPGFVRAALFRAIEQHEAFRREVSDAMTVLDSQLGLANYDTRAMSRLIAQRFIIPKPVDPLVEALNGAFGDGYEQPEADNLRAAIEKRGGKIVWGEG